MTDTTPQPAPSTAPDPYEPIFQLLGVRFAEARAAGIEVPALGPIIIDVGVHVLIETLGMDFAIECVDRVKTFLVDRAAQEAALKALAEAEPAGNA